CGLEIHSKGSVFPPERGELIVELVGIAVFVAPQSHQRFTGGNGPNPAPKTPITPKLSDAAKHFEKGFLKNILGVFHCAADAAGEVVYRGLEGAENGFLRFGVAGPEAG